MLPLPPPVSARRLRWFLALPKLGVLLLLASGASSYMTGSQVVIDGGTMLGHFR